MGEKLQEAKEQVLSVSTVVTLIVALVGGGGGAAAMNRGHEDADKAQVEANRLLVYRVEQLEQKIAQSKEAELDKRLTRIEDAQARTDEVVSKLSDLVNRIDRIVMRLPATRER